MLQATFCPLVESSMPLTNFGHGLELDVNISREGFVQRFLYRRVLLRRQIKRATHAQPVGSKS